jgi:hypothetical protein
MGDLFRTVRVFFSGMMIAFLCLLPGILGAGEADILDVEVQKGKDGSYTFSVTVDHADEGWDHYADSWDVLATNGEVLGTRVLLHPHVGEQPFTRSLTGVIIPGNIGEVIIRAHDKVHDYGGMEMEVDLP